MSDFVYLPKEDDKSEAWLNLDQVLQIDQEEKGMFVWTGNYDYEDPCPFLIVSGKQADALREALRRRSKEGSADL